MATRRIKVRGSDQRAVLALGAVAGLGLAIDGLRPTGSTAIDWILLVLVGAGAVWAAASAPWWSLSAVAGVAAAIAPPVVPLVVGLGVFALSLLVGATRRSQPIERAAVAGGAMLVLSMARELRWFGLNSLVGISLIATIVLLGLWRRSNRERQLALYAVGTAATIVAIGVLGLLAAGSAARPDLSEGNRVARQGLRQIKAGKFELAQQSFERAAAAFERADRDLGAFWAQPARLAPIASQHRRAGSELARAASAMTRTVETQLRLVDLDALRITDGRIDTGAVRSLQAPMTELQAALSQLDESVESLRSGWLLDRVQGELDELQQELTEQLKVGQTAVEALEVAPAMLGAEGPRVYFVMLTTPAEARGQGGFMGNYVELTVNDGHIEMSAFGRHSDLNAAGNRPRILTDAPRDWLARYAQFGFQKGDDRVVGEVPWSNITISPNFPATSQVVADLYPQSGGRPIDGVLSLDVIALEAIVDLLGPLDIDGLDTPLDGKNTARLLLVDQYDTRFQLERIDMLDRIFRATFDRLTSGSPVGPLDLGRSIAPAARAGRVLAWSKTAAEQELLARVGIDGELLDHLAGDVGVSVRLVNAAANKLDSFIERDYVFRVEPSGDGGLQGRLDATLTNSVPPGLPNYMTNNAVGLPAEWHRSMVTVFTSMTVESATIDGAAVEFRQEQENGSFAYTTFVDLAPGSSSTISLELTGTSNGPQYSVLVQPQPLVIPETWDLRLASESASTTWSGPVTESMSVSAG